MPRGATPLHCQTRHEALRRTNVRSQVFVSFEHAVAIAEGDCWSRELRNDRPTLGVIGDCPQAEPRIDGAFRSGLHLIRNHVTEYGKLIALPLNESIARSFIGEVVMQR